MQTFKEHILASLRKVFPGKVIYHDEYNCFIAKAPRISASFLKVMGADECGFEFQILHMLKKLNGHYYFLPNVLSTCPPWPVSEVRPRTRFTIAVSKRGPVLALSDYFFLPKINADGMIAWDFEYLEDICAHHLGQIVKHRTLTTDWYKELTMPPNHIRH